MTYNKPKHKYLCLKAANKLPLKQHSSKSDISKYFANIKQMFSRERVFTQPQKHERQLSTPSAIKIQNAFKRYKNIETVQLRKKSIEQQDLWKMDALKQKSKSLNIKRLDMGVHKDKQIVKIVGPNKKSYLLRPRKIKDHIKNEPGYQCTRSLFFKRLKYDLEPSPIISKIQRSKTDIMNRNKARDRYAVQVQHPQEQLLHFNNQSHIIRRQIYKKQFSQMQKNKSILDSMSIIIQPKISIPGTPAEISPWHQATVETIVQF